MQEDSAPHPHRRRNYTAILAFEGLWGVGLAFTYFSTIMPGYLRSQGASNLVVGIIPALFALMPAAAQPFSAYRLTHARHRFRTVVFFYLLLPLGYFGLAFSALWPGFRPDMRIFVGLSALSWALTMAGISDPHYVSMVIETAGPRGRGRIFAWRAVVLGLGGLIGSTMSEPFLRMAAPPTNYGRSFFVAGSIYLLSVITFALLYRDHPRPVQPRLPFPHYVRERTGRLLRNRAMRLLLAGLGVMVLSQSVFPFLAICAQARVGASAALLADFTRLVMAASLLTPLLLGMFADRFGHRATCALSAGLFAVGLATFGLAGARLWALQLGYFLDATALAAWAVSGFNVPLEVDPELEPSEAAVIVTSLLAPVRLAAPLLVGAGIDRWHQSPVLAACLGLALLAALLLARSAGRRVQTP